MRMAKAACAVLVCGAVAYGCSAGGGGNGTGGTGGSGSGGTGSTGYTVPTPSTTCQSFDQAFCAYDAKCNPTDTGCDQTVLFCSSDSAAQACATALGTAACGTSPTECQNAIDPQPAVDFCDALVQELCAIDIQCGDAGGTLQDCVTSLEGSQGLDCSQAIAIGKTAQQCLSDVNSAGCSAVGSSPPASCTGVLLTSGGADAGAAAPLIWSHGIPLAAVRRMRQFVSWSAY
jgi:hypothetical protein